MTIEIIKKNVRLSLLSLFMFEGKNGNKVRIFDLLENLTKEEITLLNHAIKGQISRLSESFLGGELCVTIMINVRNIAGMLASNRSLNTAKCDMIPLDDYSAILSEAYPEHYLHRFTTHDELFKQMIRIAIESV